MAVWKKTASNHVAEWVVFWGSTRSFGQLALLGLLLGAVWGVGVRYVYGLPGDSARALMSSTLKDCQEHPAFDIGGDCAKLRRAGLLPPLDGAAAPTTKAPAPLIKHTAPKPDTCASDYDAWEAMPDGSVPEHNTKWTRKAELMSKHGMRNFAAGCHDK